MKNPALVLLGITSILLGVTGFLVTIDATFPLVFFLICTGQVLLILSVNKILTDDNTTKKTFENWY